MAARGRRGPFRRGPPFRGPGPRRRGPPGPPRDFGPQFQEAEELGSREIEVENKKFVIEVKANDQGRFVKILESQTQGRGRVIFSVETASKFRLILDDFVSEYQRLGPDADNDDSERLKTETFTQGRRRYYVDLRQNQRGRFLKLTMLAGNKTFIALPGEGLVSFQEAFGRLLDEFGSGGATPPATPPSDGLPNSREVRAGGKSFFFDVERNDRGVFVRLSEVIRSGRRTHINIPHSCWLRIGEVFSSISSELPYEESASGSGSEEEG